MALASRFDALLDLEDDAPEASSSDAPTPGAGKDSKKTNRHVKQPLVWIDLEMTGLDPETNAIIEIACAVSNGDLWMVYQGPDIAIHHPEETLLDMNEWSQENHTKSGLIDRCRSSTTDLAAAEAEVLRFVRRYCTDGKAVLAGNAVSLDKEFLRRHMPALHAFLHFRIVDVSSIHELAKRWYPGRLSMAPKKQYEHTAMADLLESLEELRFYRKHVFGVSQKRRELFVEYEPDAEGPSGPEGAGRPEGGAAEPP